MASFKQHALQVSVRVLNFEGVEQSPTGGHEREPELEHVPAAAMRRGREREIVAKVSCILYSTCKILIEENSSIRKFGGRKR